MSSAQIAVFVLANLAVLLLLGGKLLQLARDLKAHKGAAVYKADAVDILRELLALAPAERKAAIQAKIDTLAPGASAVIASVVSGLEATKPVAGVPPAPPPIPPAPPAPPTGKAA